MNGSNLKLAAGLALALTAPAALAQEAGSDDSSLVEKVAVRNRLYLTEKRFEVGVNVGFTLLSMLTEHYNFNVSAAYNALEWLAVELRVGAALPRQTSTVQQVRENIFGQIYSATPSVSVVNDFSNLWEMTFNSAVGVRFQPIYGKLNLLAELPVHFQLYLWAGAGVGYFQRNSPLLCPARDRATCVGAPGAPNNTGSLREQQLGPLVSLALGFRFFLAQQHGIKLEIRTYSFLDQYWTGIEPARITPTEAESWGGVRTVGISTLSQIDLGYSFLF